MKKFLLAFALYVLAALSPAYAGVSCSVPFNLTNGTTADASQVMANYNAILSCLANNSAASGANSDITSLLGLTTPISNGQGGTASYIGKATSTGSANAQIVAATLPTGFVLTQGWQVIFYAGFTNTGAMTLLVNGQTVASTTSPVCSSGACPPSLYRSTPSGPQAMTGGEVQSGQLYVAQWDGTYFELVNTTAQFGGYGIATSLASAATTDLGTIPSHFVNITGTTTITSFGATASTTYPIYQLYFSGALTVTYNATTCSTVGNCITTPNNTNIVTAAGDTAIVYYNGAGSNSGGGGNWVFLSYNRASGQSVVSQTPLCGANNLKIVNDTGTPNTSIDVTADSAVMVNSTGVPVYATAVSVVINDTTTGANGLDTGALANATWYYHWLISNGTTTAGLDSLSATAPTLPSGYTYLCRMGAGITNSSANFLRTRQLGSDVQYIVGTNPAVVPNIANGTAGTYSLTSPTLVAVSVTGVVPPTASMLYGVASTNYKASSGFANIEVAPNTGWGGSNNGPAGSAGNVYPMAIDSPSTAQSAYFTLVLEGTTIAWASNSAIGSGKGAVSALGWRDQVNAN